MPNFKEHSKTKWSKPNHSEYPGDAEVQIGCLQRIADSLENMEQPYLKLISERERYERWYNEEKVKRRKLEKSNAALIGVINRMKKQNANG
jgi:hypothetical protein